MVQGSSFATGDVAFRCVVSGSFGGGGWNCSKNMLSAQITESIFTPSVEGEFEIIDYLDILGKLQLDGSEMLSFTFTNANTRATGTYNLVINSRREIQIEGAMKSKTYRLSCISRELLMGQANIVLKDYPMSLISAAAADVLSSVLMATLPLDIEPTMPPRDIKLYNQRGSDAMEWLRKEAVSAINPSNYLFFITQRGIHFKTLEMMFAGGIVETYKQENTIGHSLASDKERNIIAWKVSQSYNALNRARAGLSTQVMTFNTFTNQLMGATSPAQAFQSFASSIMPNAVRSIFRVINPSMSNKLGSSGMPDAFPGKTASLSLMTQQEMNMTVIGNPNLEAGKCVFCNVPEITATTDSKKLEPSAAGKWIISKLQHDIRRGDTQPRYLCHVEGLRNKLYGT